jgi:hypothetical protein
MRRVGASLAVFLAVTVAAGLTGAVASAAPPTSPSAAPANGTWSPPTNVPGLGDLSPWDDDVVTSMSCTGPGDCTAGGAYYSGFDTPPGGQDQAYVASEVSGTWGTAETVPGTLALNTGDNAATTAVSCSWPGNCVAVGYYSYIYGNGSVGFAGFVINEVNGTWGTARPVPALSLAAHFAQVTTVSCAPATTAAVRNAGLNCIAGGVSQLPGGTTAGFVLALVHGAWRTAQRPAGLSTARPGSAVTTVSCPAPGTCGFGGYYSDKSGHRQAFVGSEVNGAWRTARPVPGGPALNAGGNASVTSVSCRAAGACLAAGTYRPRKGPGQVFVVSESAGQWKPAIQLPGTGKLIASNGSTISQVSCATAAFCEVGGTLHTKATTRGFLAGEVNGRWAALYVVPDGTASTITALSCPAAGDCAAGGQRGNLLTPQNFPASAIVIDQKAGHWGKTVQLATGYNLIPSTDSVYAISCWVPRGCGAGGDVNGYQGAPLAFVTNEKPVK